MTLIQRIGQLPRIRLFEGPTPLEQAMRLSRELGVQLFLKRDDTFGLGGGGNKIRKLEFIAGQAIRDRVTALLTTGGPQSNHARLTAAVAAKLGMKAYLRLKGDAPPAWQGNLLLDCLFGAEVTFVGVKSYDVIHAEMAEFAAELARAGEVPLVVPLGGATPAGTISYLLAFEEVFAQCLAQHATPDVIVVADGTGSTHAGVLLGARLISPGTSVMGVSASWSRDVLTKEITRLVGEAVRLLGTELPLGSEDIWVEDGYVGPGYSQPSSQGQDALRLVARSEGILLDSTYTGKAFAGLVDQVRQGTIRPGSVVVFVHTGGIPELFSRSLEDLSV